MITKMYKRSKYQVIIYFEHRKHIEVICNDGRAVDKAITFEKKYKEMLTNKCSCGKIIKRSA